MRPHQSHQDAVRILRSCDEVVILGNGQMRKKNTFLHFQKTFSVSKTSSCCFSSTRMP